MKEMVEDRTWLRRKDMIYWKKEKENSEAVKAENQKWRRNVQVVLRKEKKEENNRL